jgi:hypothetical protein
MNTSRANGNGSAIQSQDLEHSSDARSAAGSSLEGDESNVRSEGARRRYECIAEAAYRRAERRAFAPGGEVDDWLAAEREFDAGGASLRD